MNGLRRINLEQAINVRDLGGYPTPDGCTPYGRFIRADNMVGLTEADLETLYQAGVRTVIDLRTPGERERQPGSFENWRDVRVVPCSLLGESLDSFTGFMRSLGENYSEMIVRDRDHYRDLFEIILSENQRGGILFHCMPSSAFLFTASSSISEIISSLRFVIWHFSTVDFFLSPLHRGQSLYC